MPACQAIISNGTSWVTEPSLPTTRWVDASLLGFVNQFTELSAFRPAANGLQGSDDQFSRRRWGF